MITVPRKKSGDNEAQELLYGRSSKLSHRSWTCGGRRMLWAVMVVAALFLISTATILSPNLRYGSSELSPSPSTTKVGHWGQWEPKDDLEIESNNATGPSSALLPEPQPQAPTLEQAYKAKISELVVGKPTQGFQENLRNDTKYLSCWVSAGWTNDFMTYINMIYLATLTSRTPIVPPFVPSHVAWDAGPIAFGDVFDVPRLSQSVGISILEWRDVKDERSEQVDELGCWSIWARIEGVYRRSALPQVLKLDVAYTAIPPSCPVVANLWVQFWTLAKLSFPSRRKEALAENPLQISAERSKNHHLPDDRLMCFDFMYYVGVEVHDEWWEEWSPAWRLVGRYARWNPKLEQLSIKYIKRALGVADSADLPPYIAVHIRRGDFTAACGNREPDKCFHPLSDYAAQVRDVAARLHERGVSVQPDHILVTSDETNPDWWVEVQALGWQYIDHKTERVEENFGKWYPPLIDAVAQSLAKGFVGTDRSTMTMVAMKRVQDWYDGVADAVPVGFWD